MIITRQSSRKPNRPWIRALIIIPCGIVAVGLLAYFVWPLFAYKWSTGVERIYRVKGPNSSYDYTITQKPANIVAGTTAQISVKAMQGGRIVSGSNMEVIVYRVCSGLGLFGPVRCFTTSKRIVGGDTGPIYVPIDNGFRYWDILYSVEIIGAENETSIGFDGSIDLSPVYPVWIGWLFGK